MINKFMMAVIAIVVSIGAFTLPTSTKVQAAHKYKMVTTVSVNIRTGDSVKHKKIGAYKKGFVKTFIGKTKKNWYKTVYKGKVGYVSGKCLTTYKKHKAKKSKAKSYHNLNKEARKHLGARYRYGASGPKCFDCSGYTSYVYKKAIKKKLPRSAKAQYRSAKKIKKSKLKKGDLVFFNYGSGIAHVGIYVGSGKMINAENNGVKYSKISSGYWKKYIAGYGRVANLD